MTALTPLLFDPVLVAKPWGGRRLECYGKVLPDEAGVGESWELADLPEDTVSSASSSRTQVIGGPHGGSTPRQLIEQLGSDLLGSASPTPAGDFPLLVKLLDASEHLSAQVHPNADYVANHRGVSLKTESWYVVEAEPGAFIYKGLRHAVDIDQLTAAVGTPDFVDLMEPHEVVAGEFHHLPAGIVHALGAGVLVAEHQTPSDTTFRLYDWTVEYKRLPRRLHLTEGLAAVDLAPQGAVALGSMTEPGHRLLIDTDHYWQREHDIADGPLTLVPGADLRIVMVVRGHAAITGPNGHLTDMPLGTTAVIPAAIAGHIDMHTTGPTTVLETGLV